MMPSPLPTGCLLAALSLSPAVRAADPEVAPMAGVSSLIASQDERLAWFKEARFGMFIHWGLYSAAGGYWPPDPETGTRYPQHYAEWIKAWAKVDEPEYGRSLKPLFTPAEGCMEDWAALAKEAGMRYAVLTTKHHEGYTLFNSKAAWSLANPKTGGTNISPAGRDLADEYTQAFRKAGLKAGFYYSLIDWQHPGGEEYRSYMHQHLDELASNYGEISCLWVDFSSASTQGSHWGTRHILENWQQKQPTAIFNNRFWDQLENDFGDFFTPEKYVPPNGFPGRHFEVNHTMNESYGFSYHDQTWKSPRQVIELLSDITSKGGNLLLNIGPDRHGRVPQPSADALREVGAWLRTHGQAIYGTEASPFARLSFNGRCTRSFREGSHRLYLHVHEWPDSGLIRLDGLKTAVRSARLLDGKPVDLTVRSEGDAILELPSVAPDSLMPVIEVVLAGELEVDAYPHARQGADGVLVLQAGDGRIGTAAEPAILRREGDHFGWWSRTEDWLDFTFRMDQPHKIVHHGGNIEKLPGRFQVILDAACAPQAGGEMEIRLGDQVLTLTLQPTGGWDRFAEIPAGELVFDHAGEFELRVRPKSILGPGIVNLRGIRLVPVP
ncbi:MAG: alpha-L-fucosidase [Akkermansiaceae bacterium]|jgi:alpha-L-fucosidase|nr:alpha-L-fucosidase [Akkermansiaceae bacterium]